MYCNCINDVHNVHVLHPLKLAVCNALRYVPSEWHTILASEFANELAEFGHIYAFRFMPAFNLKVVNFCSLYNIYIFWCFIFKDSGVLGGNVKIFAEIPTESD